MPGDVLKALSEREALAAYESRPPYQRNDYLGWITRARRDATRRNRIDRMIDELVRGDVYMRMPWYADRPNNASDEPV